VFVSIKAATVYRHKAYIVDELRWPHQPIHGIDIASQFPA